MPASPCGGPEGQRDKPSPRAADQAHEPVRQGGLGRSLHRPGRKRRSAGTFGRKHEAQDAIDAAHAAQERGAPETVGAYAASWTERHPRSKRTNTTNDGRVRQVLDVELDGRRLRDWQFRELRRRHALALVAHMLTVQGRAAGGAQNVLRTLSAMAEDAITDEVADMNWVRGVKVRANDPRATKPRREPRVLSFEQMHDFAAAAGSHQAMIRVFSDCGLRLGEVLGLERGDFDTTRSICAAPLIVECSRPATSRPRSTSGRSRSRHRPPSSFGRHRSGSTRPWLSRPRRGDSGGSGTSTATSGTRRRRRGPGSTRSWTEQTVAAWLPSGGVITRRTTSAIPG
jgi:integrase